MNDTSRNRENEIFVEVDAQHVDRALNCLDHILDTQGDEYAHNENERALSGKPGIRTYTDEAFDALTKILNELRCTDLARIKCRLTTVIGEEPTKAPQDFLIFNAPLPLYATVHDNSDLQHLYENWSYSWNERGPEGWFFAAIDPQDERAHELIELNRKQDATFVEYVHPITHTQHVIDWVILRVQERNDNSQGDVKLSDASLREWDRMYRGSFDHRIMGDLLDDIQISDEMMGVKENAAQEDQKTFIRHGANEEWQDISDLVHVDADVDAHTMRITFDTLIYCTSTTEIQTEWTQSLQD